MPIHPCRTIAAALSLFAAAAASAAGGGLMHGAAQRPTSDYGHDFVKVGRPGNRDALPSERAVNHPAWPDLGGVRHRFRIARTEVTNSQWFEFVNAYDPFWVANGGSRTDSHFTGEFIHPTSINPNNPPGYQMDFGSQQAAITMSWYSAARYCNWLHNGKVNEEWAFETGAYDTSTWTTHPGGGYADQVERSPGARFWIPNLDEWTKASYYDPNRYGEDQDGYWTRLGMQNDPLVSGLPGQGQTSAGPGLPPMFDDFINVGSYPDVQSPWGLLDTSGGVAEWVETLRWEGTVPGGGLEGIARIYRGSEIGQGNYARYDQIDPYPFYDNSPILSPAGLRLASAVPGPSAALMLLAFPALNRRRR